MAESRALAGMSAVHPTTRTYGPADRQTLALFAGGSGDHNLAHLDIEYARGIGMPDVIAHGMLTMAYLARYVAETWPAARLKHWNVRFVAVTPVNACVECSARLLDGGTDAEGLLTVDLEARSCSGVRTATGTAVLELAG